MTHIRLSNGMLTKCDTKDLPLLNAYRWHFSKSTNGNGGYAISRERGTGRQVAMHRIVMEAPKGMQVDHINRDKLDNRKQNLRFCNNAQNHANSTVRTKSGFKGVYFNKDKKAKPWKAEITFNNKPRFLGRFATPEEAAVYYNVAAQLFFGSFARLNNV